MKKAKKKATSRRPSTATAKPAPEPPGKSEPTGLSSRGLVVGFGASAGGLEAFSEILQHIPGNTGLAFVLIQHLDPNHASILTELLSRSTSMPVMQVTDGTPVERDHVYVIPPNRNLLISRGVLRLEPRPHGVHMPIDRFFRSLAEDQRERAIAVILSGTASDGTLGLKEIKVAGGISLAQDPGTARYDGMPRSAIATGCVDAVLSPEGIAQELVRLHQHAYLLDIPASSREELPEDQSFREIFSMLRNATGVDFSLYKPATVRRRTLRRMALLKLDNVHQYTNYLKQNRDELSMLFQELLINVTAFFREAVTFEAIKNSLLPNIFKSKKADEPLRIWVPGCATGEEAYSIAICTTEFMRVAGTERALQIFGTDLSDSALEKARAGVYPESIAADVSQQRLRRFFVQVNSSYQIARSIRDNCVFARHNVTKDPPFSKLDLILCRNVLIYIGPSLQATAMRLFHYALQPHGYLVLGLSESAGNVRELFAPVDKKLKIYLKRPAHVGLAPDLAPYHETSRPVHPKVEAPPAAGLTLHRAVDQMILARYSPPALVVDSSLRIVEFRGRTAPYLEHPPGEATLHLLNMAPHSLGLTVQKLVRKVQSTGTSAKSNLVSVPFREESRNLILTVSPIHRDSEPEPQFLVIFEEVAETAGAKRAPREKALVKGSKLARRVRELETELTTMREYLQTVIEEQEAGTEELKSAHEEVQSGNEELQSINEELLTAKEELQSTNEELTTVNEEMHGRNSELQQINNDLVNLLSSVNIPIVMLGSDLRIRRFTPQAEKLFSLLSTDVGRPVNDFRLKINIPDLEAVCREVLDDLTPKEREVQDAERRTYSMWVRPYRTAENRIEGVVLALFDVTERKQSAEARYRRLFETAPDGIVIADSATGEILDVNPFVSKLSGHPRARLLGDRFWESPLFKGTPMDQQILQQLSDSESIQRSMTLQVDSGRRIEAEVVCGLYTEGDRKAIQFNIRDLSARRGAAPR